MSWLTAEQRQRAGELSCRLHALTDEERRFCFGLGLIDATPTACEPCGGAAQLILSPDRRHLWPDVPKSLQLVDAVMGVQLPPSDLHRLQSWTRRDMSSGEIGIVLSNRKCWQHAVDCGWEWTLVLEDDAAAKPSLKGGIAQLLALLPELVASASAQHANWQLLALSPVGLEDFYGLCRPQDIPGLYRNTLTPAGLRAPRPLSDSGWMRIGPTFHAFGWLYRRPLMRKLLEAFEAQAPPLNPLDVWVWEVMVLHGHLGDALAPERPLVTTRSMPGGADSLRAASGPGG